MDVWRERKEEDHDSGGQIELNPWFGLFPSDVSPSAEVEECEVQELDSKGLLCRQYATQDIYITCASILQPRFLLSSTSFRGRRDLRYRTMDRYREKTSTLLTRLAHGLGRKQRPTIDRSPAPQTSPSATSRVGSLDRMLIYFVPFLQLSNFQTNSSFRFSLTSPPTRTSPIAMPGSTCSGVQPCVTTTIYGRGFYGH